MADRPTLAEHYAQATGSLTPFTTATYDPYAPIPTVGAGISTPDAPAYAPPPAYAETQTGLQQAPQAPQQETPSVWYDPANKSFNINGYIVEGDDDSALATSDQMLSGEFGGAQPTQGMVPLDMGSFQQIVSGIKNPGTWKLAKKNIGTGIDQMQQLGGYALQFAGAEELGKSIVKQQERDLEKNAVYNRSFSDIKDTGSAIDWFVSTLAQQVPNLALSAVTGGVGGVAGGVARGAAATALQGVGKIGLQLAGKKAVNKAVLSAAQKYASGAALSAAERQTLATAANAAVEKAALDAAASTALKGAALQARVGGATVGALANNLGMGIGDIYGETVEAGDPSRLKALLGAVPYALAETAPELLGAAAIFRPGKAAKAVTAGAKAAGKSPASIPSRLLKGTAVTTGKVLKGVATGGLAEGGTEAFQEGLLIAANPNLSFSDDEAQTRLVESFAGGAAVGGLFGGAGNAARGRKIKSGAPTSLLETAKQEVNPEVVNRVVEQYPDLVGKTPQDQILSLMGQGFSRQDSVAIADHLYTRNAYSMQQQPSWALTPEQQKAMQVQNATLQADALAQEAATARRKEFMALPPGTQGDLFSNVSLNDTITEQTPISANQENNLLATMPVGTQGQLFDNYNIPTIQPDLLAGVPALPDTQQTQQGTQPDLFANQPAVQEAPVAANPILQALQTQQAQAPRQTTNPVLQALQAQQDNQLGLSANQPVAANPIAQTQPVEATENEIGMYNDFVNNFVAQEQQAQQLDTIGKELSKIARASGSARDFMVSNLIPLIESTDKDSIVAINGHEVRLGDVLSKSGKSVAFKALDDAANGRMQIAEDVGLQKETFSNQVSVEEITETKQEPTIKGEANKAATSFADTTAVETIQKQINSVFDSLRSESVSTASKNQLVTKTLETFDTIGDSVQKGKVLRAVYNAASQIKLLRTQYKGKDTPIVRILKHMGLYDDVVATRNGQANVPTNRVYTADPRIIFNGGSARKATLVELVEEAPEKINPLISRTQLLNKIDALHNREPGDTNQAWDYIEEFTDPRTDEQRIKLDKRGNPDDGILIDNIMDIFEEAVKEGELTQAELKFIEDKLGVGPLLYEDGSFSLEARNKLFDKFAGEQIRPPQGRYLRADGTAIGKPFTSGKVLLTAKAFVNRLSVKPELHVFSSIEDLKTRNKKLYEAAKAAREDGKFDDVTAMGYSFGNKVILFSDNIYTDQQIKNSMSHESIGHYGLRSIMDKTSFNKMLNDVYNSSERIRKSVKEMQDLYGVSKEEATEEYLADKAVELDQSVFKRVWATIKRFLNKLGCTFDDDMALAVITQARKYIREGRLDSNSKALGAKTALGDGRFLTAASFANTVTNDTQNAMATPDDSIKFEQTLGLNSYLGKQGFFASVKEFLFDKATRGSRVKALTEGASKVASQIRTLNDLALDCTGIDKLHRIFQNRTRDANSFLSQLEQMREETRSTKTTTDDKKLAGEMLAFGSLHLSNNLSSSIAQLPTLIETDTNGNRYMVSKEKQQAFLNHGILTPEQFSKGIEYVDSLGNKHVFKREVKASDQAYKVYVEQRRAINQAALFDAQGDLAMAVSATDSYNKTFSEIFAQYTGNPENKAALDAIKKVAAVYAQMREEAISVKNGDVKTSSAKVKNAEALLREFFAAFSNEDKRMEWELRKQFNNKKPKEGGIPKVLLEREDLVFLSRAVSNLSSSTISKNSLNAFRRALHNRALSSMQAASAERRTKETIARGYVPFKRRGDKQLVLTAYDEHGLKVTLNEAYAGVVPRYHGDRVELEAINTKLNELFPQDQKFTVVNNIGNEVSVRFVPELSDAEITSSLSSQITVRDFVGMLETLNIDLDAVQTERMVKALADSTNSAMNRLHRAGNPGFDPNILRSAAEFMTSSAHSAAAKTYQYQMTDLFTDNRNWYGDKMQLENLASAVTNAPNDTQRRVAQRNYDAYARKYMHMAPESRNNKVMLGGKERACMGQGNFYKEKAKELVRWSREHSNISSITGDILNSSIGSKFKAFIVMAQLGGSVAASLINMTSIFTNSLPFFAYYNKKTAFGLGHGFGKSIASLTSAMNTLKNPKLADLSYLETIRDNGDFEKHGLNAEEIQFLIDQTKTGVLQAAQYNHLMGEAKGRIENNLVAAGVKGWMWMFSYTEELNRRATALAAFRLERERGVDYKTALDTSTIAVDTTQGDYNTYNRPSIGRHNLGQYLYMYKQFVVTSMQLLKNMDYRGRLTYLGLLFLLSGFKGMPFADDAMDIVDTLCQALGIKIGSVEEEVVKMIDDIAPGMAPYFMRGIVDKPTGLTVSTRSGMGDLLPLTGVFKAGADPWKETTNFVGPMLSGMTGTVGMALSLGSLGRGTTSFNQILRESPIAAMRMLGDAAAYATDGTVTNMTGAVITKQATPMVVMQRLLGFYPAEATIQNDVVRLTKQKDEYIKEMKAAFVGSYVRAGISNDRTKMAQLAKDVNEWNTVAKQVAPDMQITDFLKSANKALKAAKMPTGERHLKSVSKNLRAGEQQLLAMYGYEPGALAH